MANKSSGIRGPQDDFMEGIGENIRLIRQRQRDDELGRRQRLGTNPEPLEGITSLPTQPEGQMPVQPEIPAQPGGEGRA